MSLVGIVRCLLLSPLESPEDPTTSMAASLRDRKQDRIDSQDLYWLDNGRIMTPCTFDLPPHGGLAKITLYSPRSASSLFKISKQSPSYQDILS